MKTSKRDKLKKEAIIFYNMLTECDEKQMIVLVFKAGYKMGFKEGRHVDELAYVKKLRKKYFEA